jgi:sugar/nucleoside kinase (ribokinase family)
MPHQLAIQGSIEIGKSRYSGETYSPEYIGGNGILSSLAASKKTEVSLIGVIGTDLCLSFLKETLGLKIHLDSLTQVTGSTFRWLATYDRATQDLVDQDISFGVYQSYEPQLSTKTRTLTHVLFSGSRPQVSLDALKQFDHLAHIGVDAMLYHLQHNFDAALALIECAHYLFVNTQEYAYLQEKLGRNLFSHLPEVRYIFQKSGEKGVNVITPDSFQTFPVKNVLRPYSPKNAGDVFAGIIMGAIAAEENVDDCMEKVISEAQHEAGKVIMNDRFYRKEWYSRK